MDTDELIAELLNAAECDEPGMLSILPETFANAAEALAKSVREATEWRQRAEAAEAAIAEHNSAMRAECQGCKATGGACEYCSMEYRIALPARPADGGADA